jgi:hypothetical protein
VHAFDDPSGVDIEAGDHSRGNGHPLNLVGREP